MKQIISGLENDEFLIWLSQEDSFKRGKANKSEVIRHWYKYNFPNKKERYVEWITRFPRGMSFDKLKFLYGETPELDDKIFEFKSSRPNFIEYYLTRGMSHEESLIAMRSRQKNTNNSTTEIRVRSWKSTFSLKTDEEMSEINAKKSVTEKTCIERYGIDEGKKRWDEIVSGKSTNTLDAAIARGMTHDDAVVWLSNVRRKQSENSPFSLEYWNKVYPDNVGMAMIAHQKKCDSRQSFSLTYCIGKYGEVEGKRIWEERQERWLYSLYDAKTTNPDTFKNRFHGRYSASSQIFFDKLMRAFPDLEYQIATNGGELYLKHDKKRYFYDFYCPDLNLIIEYNGRYFHSSERVIENDRNKKEYAISAGYEFLVIFDDQPDALEVCLNRIGELSEKN